jgi:gluconokinase
MGVSGVGKTTVGKLLAQRLEIPFHEGDDFHSPDNIAKMERGEPLNDRDRIPWIESIQSCIDTLLANRQEAVIACSALKADYRQQLGGDRDRVEFVLLKGSRDLIQERLNQREGHFMADSLLKSQIEALEAPDDSLVVEVDQSPEAIVQSIIDQLDLVDRQVKSGN